MELPDGLVARPLTQADARAVYEVMAAEQQHDIGSVEIEEADIVGDWQRPSFDITTSTIGVFDGGQLVGYGELHDSRGDAAVDPAYRGQGIGTAIARWTQDLARTRGIDVFGMPVPQGSPGDRLLESMGYFVRWTSWVLELPEDSEIEAQPLPDGYTIRSAEGDEDQRAAHEVVEDAFLEWSERERQSYDDFAATTFLRPGYEPWHMRLVVDPAGLVAGTCLLQMAPGDAGVTGYVSFLAVRRDRRGLGLARALLADAFGNAREHGATRCELSTDSRTGALGLYEKVGMVPTSTWVHRAIRL